MTITVDPASELGRALAEMRRPNLFVRLEFGGEMFRVTPENPFLHSDPERMRAALHECAGALTGVDIEALKREIREQR